MPKCYIFVYGFPTGYAHPMRTSSAMALHEQRGIAFALGDWWGVSWISWEIYGQAMGFHRKTIEKPQENGG